MGTRHPAFSPTGKSRYFAALRMIILFLRAILEFDGNVLTMGAG
jgi:hypothetical protein